MWFCPIDGTLLLVGDPISQTHRNDTTTNHFFCRTCPYICPISSEPTQRISIRSQTSNTHSRRRMMGGTHDMDVLGGKSAWENVDRTSAVCPKCQHPEAYFVQIQIRSADEPMTIFYKCCHCNFQWNE